MNASYPHRKDDKVAASIAVTGLDTLVALLASIFFALLVSAAPSRGGWHGGPGREAKSPSAGPSSGVVRVPRAAKSALLALFRAD